MYRYHVKDIITLITDPAYFDLTFLNYGNDTVKATLRNRYGGMWFYCDENDIAFAKNEFMRRWSIHLSLWQPQFTKIYDAITEDYEPLQNYNRSESEWGGTTYAEYTDTDTYTPRTGTVTEVHRDDFQTKEKVATYDSTEKDVSTTTSGHASPTGVDRTTTKPTEPTTPGDPALTDTTDRKHGMHTDSYQKGMTVSGNIGVMSSQQMETEEIKVRQYNILLDFLALFCKDNFNTDFSGAVNPYDMCIL